MARKCHNHRLQANPWNREEGTQGIIQALTGPYICIFQVPFPFNVNKFCSDKTMILLDIGPAY